jgi:hypothetical protein
MRRRSENRRTRKKSLTVGRKGLREEASQRRAGPERAGSFDHLKEFGI